MKLAPHRENLSNACLITPYAEGLYRFSYGSRLSRDRERLPLLFVSRDIGTTALPSRINCQPQIAHSLLLPKREV